MKVIKNGISIKMNLKFQEGGGGDDDMGDIGADMVPDVINR